MKRRVIAACHAIEKELQRLKDTWVHPTKVSKDECERVLGNGIEREYSLFNLLARPNVSHETLMTLKNTEGKPYSKDVELTATEVEQVEIAVKYEGYIKRQLAQVEEKRRLEVRKLDFIEDYTEVVGLRMEAQEKLNKIRPANLGQASRISGVSPADISVLLIYLAKRK